jgi:membrane fusion protein (multidrug efflux system)
MCGDDNKVSIRTVKAGLKIDSMWIIDEGLKPGERVVADGVQKVREGMQVNPKPYQRRRQASNSNFAKLSQKPCTSFSLTAPSWPW